MKAAEETGSAFGIAGSDTVVGGEIAQGNYNTTPVPEGNGAAVQETTGGQGQTGPVTGPASAGSSSQQTANVQNSGNNTQAAQASTQNVAGVRTGDDTNITPMVILIAAAVAIGIAIIGIYILGIRAQRGSDETSVNDKAAAGDRRLCRVVHLPP